MWMYIPFVSCGSTELTLAQGGGLSHVWSGRGKYCRVIPRSNWGAQPVSVGAPCFCLIDRMFCLQIANKN